MFSEDLSSAMPWKIQDIYLSSLHYRIPIKGEHKLMKSGWLLFFNQTHNNDTFSSFFV
jgi:hypothetical protein